MKPCIFLAPFASQYLPILLSVTVQSIAVGSFFTVSLSAVLIGRSLPICFPGGGGGGYVSLGLVHHPRKSFLKSTLNEDEVLGNLTPYTGIPGNHWTTLIFRPITGICFPRMLSYTLFKYCYPFGHFDLKETKKRPIIINNNPQLSEHDTVRAHRGIAPQISYPFRGHVRGSCEFDTLFLRFPRFRYPKRDTRVTRLVAKRYPFYAFKLVTRMMYRPQ